MTGKAMGPPSGFGAHSNVCSTYRPGVAQHIYVAHQNYSVTAEGIISRWGKERFEPRSAYSLKRAWGLLCHKENSNSGCTVTTVDLNFKICSDCCVMVYSGSHLN